MEPEKKNWNSKAKLEYSKMLLRAMSDELKRNGSVDGLPTAKACLEGLKKLDSKAQGSTFTGNMSPSKVTETLAVAKACSKQLTDYISTLRSASDAYREALRQICDGTTALSNAATAITTLVTEAREDAKKRVAGIIVRKRQCDTALDAAILRIQTLAKDTGKAIAANDEKLIKSLVEKGNKMRNEYELLLEQLQRLTADMTECLNVPGRDQ